MRQVTAVTIFNFFLKHKAEKNGTAYVVRGAWLARCLHGEMSQGAVR